MANVQSTIQAIVSVSEPKSRFGTLISELLNIVEELKNNKSNLFCQFYLGSLFINTELITVQEITNTNHCFKFLKAILGCSLSFFLTTRMRISTTEFIIYLNPFSTAEPIQLVSRNLFALIPSRTRGPIKAADDLDFVEF